ncbi:MAG: OmpA family protein [Nitrospirae bacterium]|nr:OmpA family protein [Nitrospirota bacterium]
MTRRLRRLARRLTTAAPIVIIAAGCAVPTSLSPTAQLVDQAAHAVQLAESEGAVRYAPDEFLNSKTALMEATTAQSEGSHSSDFSFKERRNQNARIAAYRAWQQAELASTKARAAKARDAIAALKSETSRYQIDTQRFQAEEEAAKQARAKEIAEADRNRAMARADSEAAAKERALREKAEAELFAARETAEKERALQRSQELERARQELEAKLRDAMKEIAQVREENRGLIISLSDILFDFGKATLLPPTQSKLAQLAKILSAYADRKIIVEGHTDNIGGDAFNLQLSEARAESVRNALIDNGISPDMISAVGFGKTKPVASNDTAAGRQQNRRVEVVVLNPTATAPSGESTPSSETKTAPAVPTTPAPPAPAAPPAPQAPRAP